MSAEAADVLLRLSELGPPSEIRAHAPAEAAAALDLDRVLLSSIRDGALVPDALHAPDGDGTLPAPVALEYPLVEGEILRRRRPQVVHRDDADSAGRHAFADALGWTDYVTAPVLLDGRAIAFLHGDRRPSGRPVDETDAAALGAFALCFAIVFERAVLRHRLRAQRLEMRQMASWADARTSALGERSITLADDGDAHQAEAPLRTNGLGGEALRDLLTRREMDVLELMVRGETNAGIARDLVVSEGTVKFHVKNILRKLHASNRAEATSRYLRMTMTERG